MPIPEKVIYAIHKVTVRKPRSISTIYSNPTIADDTNSMKALQTNF